MLSRRKFLHTTLAAAGMATSLVGSPWVLARADDSVSRKRLVVVLLRGAVDGLSVVVPHGDSAYYESRSKIAIGRPNEAGGSLALDGYFGLHPALRPLLTLWEQRRLAFVHACGSPHPTRPHFDAHDYIESGTPGNKTTADGWMNRLLACLPGPHAATEALSFSPALPRILSGALPVTDELPNANAARPSPLDRARIADAFDSLYDGADPLSCAYQEAQSARQELHADMSTGLDSARSDLKTPSRGAPNTSGFSPLASRFGRLMNKDSNIRLAFVEFGGWDTHVDQGNATGQLANHLQPLAEGLVALAQALGDSFTDTTVIVMSEFGRTVSENGNGGTHHGHANVMWLLGGEVHGEWPGLLPGARYEGRDLAVTTDFRQVLSHVIERAFRLDDHAMTTLFPCLEIRRTPLSTLLRA